MTLVRNLSDKMVVELRSAAKAAGTNNNNDDNNSSVTSSPAKKNGGNNEESKMTVVVFIGLLIDLLAFTLILPLFPTLLDHYKKHDSPDGLYHYLDNKVKYFGALIGAPEEQFNSVLFGGLLGSLFSFLQFVASPLIGGLSDHFGRRPMLLLSTTGVLISYAMWVNASTFSLFVLARVVGGLAKGNVSLATAIIADVSTPKTRQKGMAMIGIAFSIGFIVGPLVGAGFAVWAKGQNDKEWYIYPAFVAMSLSLVDLIYLMAYFKETLAPEKRLVSFEAAIKQAVTYINPISLFRFESLTNLKPEEKAGLQTLGRVYFLYLFLYSGLEFTLTFLTHLRFNFTSMDQGKMFLFIGTLMALVQGGYVRKRIPPGKEKAMVLRGLLIIVPSFAIVGFAQNKLTLYFGLALYALSTSVVVPCMTTMVSHYGNVSQKGIVMGVYRSLGALGRALGPVAASILYWMTGPEICYSIGGLGLIIPYLMLKRSKT
jgi:MFS family permease